MVHSMRDPINPQTHRSCTKLIPLLHIKDPTLSQASSETLLMENLFYCNSQGRDQRICLWDLAEGRTAVTDSVCTENVGFCRCSLLKVAQGRWLMAMAAKALEEVGSVSFSGAWEVAFGFEMRSFRTGSIFGLKYSAQERAAQGTFGGSNRQFYLPGR